METGVGWENKAQNNSAVVLQVIKYDKSWNCLGYADLYNADTTIPFDSGSLRCSEDEGTLFIHTSHEMYDGHQSNMTVAVRESDMLIMTRNNSDLRQFYVSHSFNQFVLLDQENNIVTLDHGDGYPRAVYLQRSKTSGRTVGGTSAVVQRFPGTTGDNTTGASIGGLTETSSGYITAYNYNGLGGAPEKPGTDWLRSPDPSRSRNIYLSYTPKNNFSTSGTVITQLTDYNTGGNYTVGTPVLVSTGLDGGYVLWREHDKGNSIYYVSYFDGGKVSSTKTAIGSLSDCQPIEYQGKIVWYVTDGSAPVFYVLDEKGIVSYSAKYFTDVPVDAYYAKAVAWAIEKNITSGTSSTTFSPDDICTQAQILTFLWRAKGKPTPNGTAMLSEADMGTYYSDAVRWAKEQSIIDDTFLANDPCTRADVVTYLWKMANAPAAKTNTFLDVPTDETYAQAVAWAVQQNITAGTSDTTFSPNDTCTRGQIATFLYRGMA